MICDKCKGRGWIENPHLFQVPGWMAYERGYSQPIKCKRCNGSGFLIGNAQEVMETIDIAIRNNKPLSVRELKEIKLILQM